jgi:hypothetical protein
LTVTDVSIVPLAASPTSPDGCRYPRLDLADVG